MRKLGILRLSCIITIPSFIILFFLNVFNESLIFSLKNIITIVLFCVLNLFAVIFEISIRKLKENEGQNNKKIRSHFSSIRNVGIIIYILLFVILFVVLNYLYFSGVFIIFPHQKGLINDYADLLIDEEIHFLSNIITEYESKGFFKIIIVTIDDIVFYNDPIKYFQDLGNYWSQKNSNNTILIGSCTKCRYICIIPDNKLSEKYTSDVLAHTLNNILIPEFSNESNYFNGLRNAILDLYLVYENITK